ncbi:uncharacterized protein [Ranitomeya imitator]|uniref:uncharacterized protein n=3 Tax=Ranitomeya imitator TaxID=111125 RepID=UPI0037E97BA0
MDAQYPREQCSPLLASTQLEPCMSPDWRNNFITQNYARIEAVAPIADNGPALHLIMDTDTETSDAMAENWCVPEPRDTLGSDVEIIDVKNPATSAKPDAPKRRGNSLHRCFKNRKVARKIQLEKENIPASASLSIAPPVKPGADVGQFPLHTYTSPLQQRVLHWRNYDTEENQPQRANTAVRTTSLSPICVVDRDECYAAPKQPGNPSPKISHQKYTNVSREKRAAPNARPRITRPANSTGAIPQVTPENREIEQLSEGLWSPTEPLNIPVCQTVQSADTALADFSSVFAPVLPLKKRTVSRRRVGRKQKVAVHTPYTGRPSWDADHVKMFTDMSAQYAQSKLAQMELKSFCDTYERLLNACPTHDITEELRAFKLNHP